MNRAPAIVMTAKAPGEAAALRIALGRLNEAFASTSDEAIAQRWSEDDPRDVWALLPVGVEAFAFDDDWATAEARFRAHAVALARRTSRLYLVTALRRSEDDPQRKRLHRLCRLNLLAMELSQELSAFVIDVDRALAAVGARICDADFRLASSTSRAHAAQEIARALAATGIDSHASLDGRRRVAELLSRWTPDASVL